MNTAAERLDKAGSRWASPGRVNLIGEHTDYNDGFVLPFALPQATAVSGTRRPDKRWVVTSEQTGETVTFDLADLSARVGGWAAYVAAVVWVLREAGVDVPGAELNIASDVPFGAGLSSSAALECAAMAVLADLAGLDGDGLPMRDRPRRGRTAPARWPANGSPGTVRGPAGTASRRPGP